MNAEIITIGTELLLGHIVDTNSAYLARRLADVGLNLYRITTVGDNEGRIAAAIREALARCRVVIATGGLGPTEDDVTRQAVARATDRPLVLDERLLAQIEAFFARRGLVLSDNNRRQALIPEGAIPIENPVGTAPGFVVEADGRYVITLPGVPREMRHLTETTLLPFLRERLGLTAVIKSRMLHTVGVPESQVDRLIADLEQGHNPTVGLAAHPGQVDLRITARADRETEADALLATMEAQVRERLGKMIYGADDETLEGVVGRLLRERGLTLAVLETNSGGGIVGRLTRTRPGQRVLREGWVVTDAQALARRLGWPEVPDRWLEADVATEAASRLREVTGADLGLVVLGDPDPGLDLYSGERGQTWLALATPADVSQRELPMAGSSKLVRNWVINAALNMLRLSCPEAL